MSLQGLKLDRLVAQNALQLSRLAAERASEAGRCQENIRGNRTLP